MLLVHVDDTDGILDSTLSFFFGQAPRTELFCGYIVNVKEDEAGQGNLTFTLSVFGATQGDAEGPSTVLAQQDDPCLLSSRCVTTTA